MLTIINNWDVLPKEHPTSTIQGFVTTYPRTYTYAIFYVALDNSWVVEYYGSNTDLAFSYSGTTLSFSNCSSMTRMDDSGAMSTSTSTSRTITASAKEVRIRKCAVPMASPDAVVDPLRFLYQIGEDIYNIQEGQLVKVAETPITEDLFLSYGNPEVIPEVLQEQQTIRILAYTQEPQHCNFRLTTTGITKPQVITQKRDFSCPTPKKLTITARVTGSDILRVFVSPDSGETWGVCSTAGEYTSKELGSIASEGMTVATVNGLPTAALQKLVADTGTLRLAFYLEHKTTTNIIYIDEIRLDFA